MKKGTAFGLALMLALPSMSSVALADGVEEVVENGEVIESTEIEEVIEDIELELIDSLSLETVLELALEDNYSLMLLNYQLELIETQAGGADKNYGETAFDIKDLERTKKRLQKAGGSGSFQDRLQIQNQLEALEDKIEMVESALDQVKSGKITLTYTEEEAKANIKMATTATYTQLLMATEQQELKKKALKVKEKEVAMMKRQYDLGVLSRDDHTKELREIERQEIQIELDKKEWGKNLAEFALDLGVVYHPDLTLQPLNLGELKLIEQQMETKELIENSFKYKSQLETIDLSEKQRVRVYDDKDSDSYDKSQADLNVKIEKEKLEQFKLDAAISIRQLYYDVEDSYQAILDAERELKFAEADYKTLKRRYELGLLSYVNYELASIRVDQAELVRDVAKESYFLVTKKVELVEAGVVQ